MGTYYLLKKSGLQMSFVTVGAESIHIISKHSGRKYSDRLTSTSETKCILYVRPGCVHGIL